ncbi:MAG: ATPase [Promethearchaeota archaeon CR_4]|nr:MAG: ATPase [Candidatus Lokiarchaeota archaeon CR_4]
MVETVTIEDVQLVLSHPENFTMEWIGNQYYVKQLLAAWLMVDKQDQPLNPRVLGPPGIGKTTLACAAAKQMGRPVYIYQATADTRPEDLLVQPVISARNEITYHASPLVTAMLKGSICVLDEGNRMSEKSWASLAPLLDHRRYVESIIAGIKIPAHPDFRICCTMNNDASTYEIPEYIHSRLQPQITIEFPDREDELKILKFNLPFCGDDLLNYVVDFLQRAHAKDEPFSVRDGINIARYCSKLMVSEVKDLADMPDFVQRAVQQILGEKAIQYLSNLPVSTKEILGPDRSLNEILNVIKKPTKSPPRKNSKEDWRLVSEDLGEGDDEWDAGEDDELGDVPDDDDNPDRRET